MVVDDEPDHIELVQILLRRAHVPNPVLTFTDSADALAFLRELHPGPDAAVLGPGVLFLDLKMPKVHGFVLLKWLRQQSHFDSMAIAVLSGSDMPEDRLRSEKLGADRYLVKFPAAEIFAEICGAGLVCA